MSELLSIEVAMPCPSGKPCSACASPRYQRAGGHRGVRHSAKAPGDRSGGQQVRHLPSGQGGASRCRTGIASRSTARSSPIPKEMRKKRAEKAKEEGGRTWSPAGVPTFTASGTTASRPDEDAMTKGAAAPLVDPAPAAEGRLQREQALVLHRLDAAPAVPAAPWRGHLVASMAPPAPQASAQQRLYQRVDGLS